MKKENFKVKKELLDDLSKQDIPSYEVDYIISVVNYMDEQMSVSPEETAKIGSQIDKMLEIAKRIRHGKTGVPEIDQIKSKRKEDAVITIGRRAKNMDFSTKPYINNYIGIISENGGLYGYVNKIYESEINKPYKNTTPTISIKSIISNAFSKNIAMENVTNSKQTEHSEREEKTEKKR